MTHRPIPKPHLRVEHISRAAAFVSGSGARQALSAVKGRVPMWSSTRRAYAVTPATAADAEAYATERGWSVVVADYQQQELF